ncbi:MAG: hypothetical protein ACI8RD_011377 [Bacillariaceae sp.]|jgi:hypothetical protein
MYLQGPKPSSSGNHPHFVNLNFLGAIVSGLGVQPSDSLLTTLPIADSNRRSRSIL